MGPPCFSRRGGQGADLRRRGEGDDRKTAGGGREGGRGDFAEKVPVWFSGGELWAGFMSDGLSLW